MRNVGVNQSQPCNSLGNVLVSDIWSLNNATASSRQAGWLFQLDPAQPSSYASFEAAGQQWPAAAIFPLPSHSLTIEEAYVRTTDFIVRYAESEHDAYTFQLNWRMLGDLTSAASHGRPGWCGVELWVSIQTRLLDAQPQIEIRSAGQAGTWRMIDHGQLIERPALESSHAGPAALVSSSDGATLLWLIQPSDQLQAECLSSPEDAMQRVQLFDHFMEKGVIRRARMQFWACAGALSTTQIASLYREFCESPLPLTA